MGLLDVFRRTPDPAPKQRTRFRNSLRAASRAMESFFSAADTGRLNASWGAYPLPADVVIRNHQIALVARSRQQSSENDYAKSFLRLCRQNIVGPKGVMYKPQTGDEKTDTAILKAWREWGRKGNCEVTGRKTWRDIELSAVQAAAKDGEFMFRKIYGADAGPWRFALQQLDPQRCPVNYDLDNFGGTGNFIRHGIEHTQMGRAVAFHFTTTNESEMEYTAGGMRYIRVPAEEIIHGFRDELGGQKRGLPWMSTGLFKLRHIGGTEDAATINARIGAAKMGVIEWADGTGPEMDDDDIEAFKMDGEPGSFPMLPPGAKLNTYAPQYPSGEFGGFMKHMLRSVAAGWGVPYNELACDLEGVNFSSIRQGTLDSRERWQDDQEWLVDQLHREVMKEWLPHALLSRRIVTESGQALQASQEAKYSQGEWQPRRWTWIDPNADVKAAVESKNNLLKSPGELIREGGRDPLTVFREIAADIEAMKAAGIPEEIIKLAFSDKLAPPPPTPPASKAK